MLCTIVEKTGLQDLEGRNVHIKGEIMSQNNNRILGKQAI
jgi:hypothetical protein